MRPSVLEKKFLQVGEVKVGEVVKVGKDAGVQVGDTVLSFGMLSNEERGLQEYVLTSKYMVGKVRRFYAFHRRLIKSIEQT